MSEREVEILHFPIGWINKENLLKACPDLATQIDALNSGDLEYIARKVGDLLQEDFLIAVQTVLAGAYGESESEERYKAIFLP